MILECHLAGHWHRVGTIGQAAGRRFLARCRDPHQWRLRKPTEAEARPV